MRGAKYKGDTSNNVLNNTHSFKTLQYTMTKWSTLCKAKCTDIFNQIYIFMGKRENSKQPKKNLNFTACQSCKEIV